MKVLGSNSNLGSFAWSLHVLFFHVKTSSNLCCGLFNGRQNPQLGLYHGFRIMILVCNNVPNNPSFHQGVVPIDEQHFRSVAASWNTVLIPHILIHFLIIFTSYYKIHILSNSRVI
ncbi:hypothetical protein ATANTOWER_013609 [Ataeniobius toweri]|uniref:Uncharacterized protein n=1 Tax=Ataeniobius toweri TaxID=208326 RepID=A0ABU7BXD0_9TELE|nr:hypothetical protein [Ataeniobius toweri]